MNINLVKSYAEEFTTNLKKLNESSQGHVEELEEKLEIDLKNDSSSLPKRIDALFEIFDDLGAASYFLYL